MAKTTPSTRAQTIRRALISVSDKTGVVTLARALVAHGVEILSTGGTARLLTEHELPVTEVSQYTGFPEIMDGRIKTLHPRVHGGILARRGTDEAVMKKHGIAAIDLVVVNLYPFEQTVAKPRCSLDEAIENIDIGGPALLRAAAKNHAHVLVVVDATDYEAVVEALANGVDAPLRARLAARAFAHTAAYDAAVAGYLAGIQAPAAATGFADTHTLQLQRCGDALRYGENPHQAAAFYREPDAAAHSIARARQLQGKPLSFNNLADADAALECVRAFGEEVACVIVKHANPCGVAIGADLTVAYTRAYATDPTSAFGGIIAFNRPLDAHTAKSIIDRQFVEVIIAPDVDEEALQVLAEKKNLRVLACSAPVTAAPALDYRRVSGGMLIQEKDDIDVLRPKLKTVTERKPTREEMDNLLFAWRVCKYVKSNAIVYGRDGQTLGIGAGQMSRVDAVSIAAAKAKKANLDLRESVVASDAFFPFRDGLDAAASVGVTAVIQPGGSMRDKEVIQAADERNLAMVFTSVRHFRH